MALLNLAHLTWEDVRDLDRARTLAILPTGALEAHGPHLPLCTDVLIAEAMARSGGERLASRGYDVLILPSLPYTAADFAAGFPGTVSLAAATVTASLLEIASSLSRHGLSLLAVANSHLDPTHRSSLAAAATEARRRGAFRIVAPDLAAKPWATRLGEEFKSGACHAGRYETSVVLAVRQDLVREDRRRDLPANPRSLSDAIREGKRSFEEAAGPLAYFGDPAAATADEGWQTIDMLGSILEEAVLAELASADRSPVSAAGPHGG